MSLLDRFYENVEVTDGCWLWTGKPNVHGYGKLHAFGQQRHAHRIAYELFVGEIPDDHVVHHACEDKLCVNPAHLQTMTRLDHSQLHLRKEVCKWGHPITPAPTPGRPHRRKCRTCEADAQRRYRERLLT